MTDLEDIKHDIASIRSDLRDLTTSMHALQTSRAVGDERQIETSKKLDILSLQMANNYVGAVEFKTVETRIGKLENWLVRILRLTVGAVVLAAIAAARIKGGL